MTFKWTRKYIVYILIIMILYIKKKNYEVIRGYMMNKIIWLSAQSAYKNMYLIVVFNLKIRDNSRKCQILVPRQNKMYSGKTLKYNKNCNLWSSEHIYIPNDATRISEYIWTFLNVPNFITLYKRNFFFFNLYLYENVHHVWLSDSFQNINHSSD